MPLARIINTHIVHALLLLLPVTGHTAGSLFEPSGPRADEIDVNVLLNSAEQGDARACYLLGTRYASGRGGARDDSEAVRWFRKSADLGLAEGQYNLAIMHATGRGLAKDHTSAFRWMLAAAEQDLPQAQYRLALMYSDGQGTKKSYQKALKWFKLASANGVSGAQYNVGLMYEYGIGVSRNLQIALSWYKRAAENGVHEAFERAELIKPGFLASLRESRDSETALAEQAETRITGEDTRGLKWLQEQDKTRYTIQLLVSSELASIENYIERHDLGRIAHYVPTRRNGSSQYTLVTGSYGSHTEALRSIRQLPHEVQQEGPFVKAFTKLRKQVPAGILTD